MFVCAFVSTFHSCPSAPLEWNSSLLWHRLKSLVQCPKKRNAMNNFKFLALLCWGSFCVAYFLADDSN